MEKCGKAVGFLRFIFQLINDMLGFHKYAIKFITSTNSRKLCENQNSLTLPTIVCVFKDVMK